MKGVSPLLASIMLIAIVIVVGAMTSGWMTSTVRSAQASSTNKTDTGLQCSGASISIEKVYVTGTAAATVTASVRNSGLTDGLVIQSAQIFNTTGSNFTSSSTPVTAFDRGEIETLTFRNVNFASCPGAFSELRVTTSCGGIADFFTDRPSCS
ncbi:MAG: hypothetical protein J4431_01910 [Candidatus Aenigmarchaeota archaeon]|nr:hypothetical protein [Candidatus Aenigmarchaeota archaeon]